MSLDKSSPNIRRLSTDSPFYTHRLGSRQAVRIKNIAGLLVTFPGLSVGVTGLSLVVYGLSVSVYGLSVTNFPDSATQSVKVTNWPVNFTGLSGTVTDRPAKVTDCTVTLPVPSVSHHIQSGSPYLGQARYLLQTGLFDRGLKLGLDTRVDKVRRLSLTGQ